MFLVHAKDVKPAEASGKIAGLLSTISATQLREWVERIAVPRHFEAEARQNRAIAEWLGELFRAWGYAVELQGPYANVVARPQGEFKRLILVGAHYDSVRGCPGADDNGSAVAAMLACAAAVSLWRPALPVGFVAFNREEDGLLGSRDFVESYLPHASFKVEFAHVLEMVGFANSEPGSQHVPTGLPISLGDKGDFLGLLANGDSQEGMDLVMKEGRAYVSELPMMGLKVKLGLEKFLPVLARSDHAPFWERNIPALMWTDTSEFRNSNYHRLTDTPETLDYEFLRRVSQTLTATVISQGTVQV